MTTRPRHRLALPAACALSALLCACADPPPGERTPTPTPTPGSEPCAGIVPSAGRGLALRTVASGLDRPLHLTFAPGDATRLFLVEQAGRIRLIEQGQLRAEPFLDLRDRVGCCGERGLLSLAFHPRFAGNGRLFVAYTEPGGDLLLAEFFAPGPERADPASERIHLRIEHSRFSNHNGGLAAFAPDGLLYLGVGDGGGAGDPLRQARDPGSLLGKLNRFDASGAELVPAPGNPFGNPVWHVGLRNPWRFSFDRATGDLYLGDVGQDRFEEIDFVPAGARGGLDFGWSAMEGNGHCFNDPGCAALPVTLPVLEYPTASGCAVTGGFVYRGCALPAWHGTYFWADFCAGELRSFRMIDGIAAEQQGHGDALGTIEQLASLGEDARGELYLVSLRGSVHQVVAR